MSSEMLSSSGVIPVYIVQADRRGAGQHIVVLMGGGLGVAGD